MKAIANYLRVHLPTILVLAGIVFGWLVDNGYINSSSKGALLVIALLNAVGVQIIHVRQQKQG